MSVKWKDGYNIEQIATELQATIIRQPDGSVGFEYSSRLSDLESLLRSAVDFDDAEIPEDEKYRIVSRSVSDAANNNQITKQALKARLSIFTEEFINLPQNKFTLLTSISVKNNVDLKKVVFKNHTITFSRERPTRFEQITYQALRERSLFGFQLPEDFIVVRVSGNGRSESEAAENALFALDFLRGMWNFSLNWLSFRKTFGGRPKPINKIRLGPTHTLHERNGKLASQTIWYDYSFSPVGEALDVTSVDWSKVKNTEAFIRSRTINHAYPDAIVNAMVRYARALDNHDLNTAFLGLWSVLEYLTDTRQRPYKETARRAAFLYEEMELRRQVGLHLAEFRNRYVHVGAGSNEIETLVHQVKAFVEQLLQYHFINTFKFKTLEEAGTFLHSPYTLEDINKAIEEAEIKIRQLESARSFRKL